MSELAVAITGTLTDSVRPLGSRLDASKRYFQWANGSFTSVNAVGGGLIYYLPRFHPSDKTNVTAFPDGFRVLTGNPFKRFYDASSDQDQAIGVSISVFHSPIFGADDSAITGWNCLGAPVSATRQPYLPPYNCPNGLRGEIRFPSCWNGVDVQSSDHFSHMAYPIGGESGPCPSTHPVRLVGLLLAGSFRESRADPRKRVSRSRSFTRSCGASTRGKAFVVRL